MTSHAERWSVYAEIGCSTARQILMVEEGALVFTASDSLSKNLKRGEHQTQTSS
jgi:uncharacterized protein YcfL